VAAACGDKGDLDGDDGGAGGSGGGARGAAHAVERGRRRGGGHSEVRGDDGDVAGERPGAERGDGDDVREAGERGLQGGNVDAGRRGLEERAQRLARDGRVEVDEEGDDEEGDDGVDDGERGRAQRMPPAASTITFSTESATMWARSARMLSDDTAAFVRDVSTHAMAMLATSVAASAPKTTRPATGRGTPPRASAVSRDTAPAASLRQTSASAATLASAASVSARPYPYGMAAVGGRAATTAATSDRTTVRPSSALCTASAPRADDPETAPATSCPTHAAERIASAVSSVRVSAASRRDSPCECGRNARQPPASDGQHCPPPACPRA
jgi:hypothetical protein